MLNSSPRTENWEEAAPNAACVGPDRALLLAGESGLWGFWGPLVADMTPEV